MTTLKLAWRNLRRNRRRTLITLSSIALGCTFAIFIFALGAGIHKKTISDATRMLAGHITVEEPGYRDAPGPDRFVPSVAKVKAVTANMPEVELVKSLCTGNGVVASAANAAPIGFLGVEPEQEKEVSRIAKTIVKGRFITSADLEGKGVVIGTRLAERMHVDIGNKLVLTTSNAQGELVEELLHVVGIFKVGSEAMDGEFIEMPITVARKVMGLTDDQATQVGLILKDPESEDRVLAATKVALADSKLAVYPWQTLIPALATWVSFGDARHHLICGVVLFLASFTILNTILMSVMERKREFAMLLALGTPPRMLQRQVFVETLLIAVVGSIVGLAIGGAIAFATGRHGIDMSTEIKDGEAPTVGALPVDLLLRPSLTASDAIFVVLVVLITTIVIAIYPTLRSTRIDVATTLRSE